MLIVDEFCNTCDLLHMWCVNKKPYEEQSKLKLPNNFIFMIADSIVRKKYEQMQMEITFLEKEWKL